MKRFVVSVALLTALAGCYKVDYVQFDSKSVTPDYEEWHHIGVLGLVEFSKPVRLDEICPNGFAKVHHEVSLENAAVAWVGGAITSRFKLPHMYSPSTISVYCKSGHGFLLDTNDEGLVVTASRLVDTR